MYHDILGLVYIVDGNVDVLLVEKARFSLTYMSAKINTPNINILVKYT